MFVLGAGVLALIFVFPSGAPDMFGPRTERVEVRNRIKPDVWEVDPKAKMGRGKGKGPQETFVKLSNGKRFIIPIGKEGLFQREFDGKKWRKFWEIEGGQIIERTADLAKQANPLLDQETVTAVTNRGSARRLAAQAASGDKWTWIIMGAAVAFALAWIMYPQLNHPTPVLVYCTRLANGTVIPKAVCPG